MSGFKNLREKFNQPVGTLSPPGTSFGAKQTPKVEHEIHVLTAKPFTGSRRSIPLNTTNLQKLLELDARNDEQSKEIIKIERPKNLVNGDLKCKVNKFYSGVRELTNGDDCVVERKSKPEDDSSSINLKIQLQKVSQNYSDLERKYKTLQDQNEESKKMIKEKDDQLQHLRMLSEAMYKEYDELNHKYSMETSTMQEAIKRASVWYKQNRELKRRSTLLMQHVMMHAPESIQDVNDEVDASESDNEIDILRDNIKDLTQQISRLQADFNLVTTENKELRERIEELNNVVEHERNFRQKLESETVTRMKHREEPNTLEEKLQIAENELEITTKRAVKAENESLILSNRVVDLEKELSDWKNRATKSDLILDSSSSHAPFHSVSSVSSSSSKSYSPPQSLNSDCGASANSAITPPNPPIPSPPPLPSIPQPPPPPPPPPLPVLKPQKKVNGASDGDLSAADQMANLLKIEKKPKAAVQGGAIDELINEIKGGKFNLKTIERKPKVKTEQSTEVVSEFAAILGTLRRKPARKNGLECNTVKNI